MSSLNDILALEHEAVWTYGLIGGSVDSVADLARACFEAHRTQRDRLLAHLDDAVEPQTSYAPATIADEATARTRAQDLEQRISAAWVGQLSSDEITKAGLDRGDIIGYLATAETTRLSWGGTPNPFPGLD